MSNPDKGLCQDCGERTTLVKVRPVRYDDGFRRCRPCAKQRVDSITAYWREATAAFAPSLQNRGGRFTIGTVSNGTAASK